MEIGILLFSVGVIGFGLAAVLDALGRIEKLLTKIADKK